MTLKEYAKKHPPEEQPEQEPFQDGAEIYRARQEARAEAERLKADIIEQIRKGTPPQFILYRATKAIGLFTEDPDYTETAEAELDALYGDLAQQSFILDTEAEALRNLETRREEYFTAAQKKLRSEIYTCQKLERALQEALQTIQPPEQGKTP